MSDMTSEREYMQVPPEGEDTAQRFDRFVKIIAALRSDGGCPWDREQTHASISRNMIEEAFEAVAAIEKDDPDDMSEELGDVLLEVVLQAQIGSDNGEFDIDDVIEGITQKMIRRHPHVFGAGVSLAAAGLTDDEVEAIRAVNSADDVSFLWDLVKKREKATKAAEEEAKARARGEDPERKSILDDVPVSLPALMQAQDISRKAVAHGFEWDTRDDVWDKFREEMSEYEEARANVESGIGTTEQAELEFGDMLFTLVNVARKDGIDAESALRKTCGKFRRRWSIMEKYADDADKTLDAYDIDGLEGLWQDAKSELRGKDGNRS